VQDSSVWLSKDQVAEQVRNETIDKLVRSTTVRRSGLTYIISIQVSTTDPALAAEIANTYASEYVLNQVQSKFDSSRVMNDWLNSRLEDMRIEVQVADKAVDDYRRSVGLLNVTGADLVERQIVELSGDVAAQQRRLEESEAKLETASRSKQTDSLSPVILSDTIVRLRTAQAQLQEERGRIQSTFGPLHPSFLEIEQRATALDREVRAEIDRIVASLESDVSTARRGLEVSKQRLRDLSGRATENNSALVKLNELDRQAAAARTLYEQFLSRNQEISVISELKQPAAQSVSSAVIPAEPVSPNPRLQLAIALLAGAAAGVFSIMLREVFESHYLSSLDVERRTGLVCVTSIPAVPEPPHQYAAKRPFSFLSECIRRILSDIEMETNVRREGGTVVAVVAAGASEGKTSTVLGLSVVAQQAGRTKVLVIDADMRKNSLSQLLHMTEMDGLNQYLSGELTLDKVIHTDKTYGFDVLPCAFDPNYPALYNERAVAKLLQEVRTRYDLIFIDTAAFLAISETRYFIRACDQVIALIRWRSTKQEDVRVMLATLQRHDRKPRFGVLTRYKGPGDAQTGNQSYYFQPRKAHAFFARKRDTSDQVVGFKSRPS
jgi:uncharacterized protein involved in exopolysaccharide biosynthesis/Mrp family chromosome partitioning ATPase